MATTQFRLEILPVIPESIYTEASSLAGVTLYHTAPWHHVLTKSFAWKVHAAIIRNANEELLWYLPFVRKRRLGLSRLNVCLPLSNKIGPAYRSEINWANLRIPYQIWPLEIHEYVNIPQHRHRGQHHFTTLSLSGFTSLEDLRKSFHKTSVQQSLKKAEKGGVRIAKATNLEMFDTFNSLQAETRQRQGSPTYPKSFFRNIWEELKEIDAVHLYLAYLEGRAVCGVLFLHFQDTAIYGYGASLNDRSVWRSGANQLAMFAAIREAFERKLARVEFGTSPITQPDLRIYKERWNGESYELPYTYGGSQRAEPIDRGGAGVKAMSWALQRLPRPVFSAISPLIMRAVV